MITSQAQKTHKSSSKWSTNDF